MAATTNTVLNGDDVLNSRESKKEHEERKASEEAEITLKELSKEGGALLLGLFFSGDSNGDIRHYEEGTDLVQLGLLEEMGSINIIRLIICPEKRKKEVNNRLKEKNIVNCHVVSYQSSPKKDTKTHQEWIQLKKADIATATEAFKTYVNNKSDFKKQLGEVIAVKSFSTAGLDTILNVVGIHKNGSIPFLTIGEHGASSHHDVESEYRIRNYGVITYANTPEYRHMGFSPNHHGIFIKPVDATMTKAKALASIRDKRFLRFLLNSKSEHFDDKMTHEFLETTLLVPCYWQDTNSFLPVVEGILASDIIKQSNYKKVIFVVNPGNLEKKEFNKAFLIEHKIKSIEICHIEVAPEPGNPNKLVKRTDPLHSFSEMGIEAMIAEGFPLVDLDYELFWTKCSVILFMLGR